MNKGKTNRLDKSYLIRTTGIVFLNFYTCGINAANWDIEPEISIQEVYTDNVRIAPKGFEDSEYITVITPSISVSEDEFTRFLEFELHYALQNIFYANNSSENDNFHLLNVKTKSELYKEHLFLDMSLKYSPHNIRNTGSTALDNLSISDSRSNVLYYNINPSWRQRLGNFSDVNLGYSRNEVRSNQFFDSRSDSYSANMSSGPLFTRLLWDISYNDKEIDNERFQTTRLRYLRGQILYLLTRKFAVKGSVGYDDNKFLSNSDIDGLSWMAGFVWNPSRRTSVEATAGERFFGKDLFVNIRHRTRSTRWSVSFEREPTTTRATIIEQQVFELVDPFGEPIVDPVTGVPATLNINVPVQTAEVLVRSRLGSNVEYQLKKNKFYIGIFYEDQKYLLSEQHQKSKGGNASWIWNIGENLSSKLSAVWSETDLRSGNHDEYLIGEYSLTQSLGRTIKASISVRHVNRNSDISNREYEENRISIILNKRF